MDDCLAFVRPWGFATSDIRVPTSIWYGPDDVLTPRRHAEWLATHIPGAERHALSGGHIITMENLGRVLRWLTP